ncbi:hypothetical protein [Rhodococcus tibetensis]|uniref:Uncharacterized protein n=1 Tax=Rhodococcus tibetensis TaxID=2965064 RepID=A0ABT1QE06_9NOCA|nr:hypothetical protein [Rhodococcus sp. FXJ9.536]MCQ4120437.1 hypothetical protein [Rhodococcus sp. FXJ9.536]
MKRRVKIPGSVPAELLDPKSWPSLAEWRLALDEWQAAGNVIPEEITDGWWIELAASTPDEPWDESKI